MRNTPTVGDHTQPVLLAHELDLVGIPILQDLVFVHNEDDEEESDDDDDDQNAGPAPGLTRILFGGGGNGSSATATQKHTTAQLKMKLFDCQHTLRSEIYRLFADVPSSYPIATRDYDSDEGGQSDDYESTDGDNPSNAMEDWNLWYLSLDMFFSTFLMAIRMHYIEYHDCMFWVPLLNRLLLIHAAAKPRTDRVQPPNACTLNDISFLCKHLTPRIKQLQDAHQRNRMAYPPPPPPPSSAGNPPPKRNK